ncbi:helix-turn-helix domain-containing protein [Bacillus cereus]|uniref:helix-turn-helix domain-containing protein n=1 Tax=Bacillus cereus TaxID=1396 RepID=UPI000847619F|nr:helix-turn-helix domain-containing protein [Bacillus cereus]AOM07581.1 hypothetical protein FORC24_4291 [Bacillus cereus]MCC2366311.1 helix-turn-helix domain-containing protein [Bacillus cereus]MCC2447946.1 helix-turn-helix domain-containing protein [Bacillus cereus]MCC2490909.1 helix-turn-helix domain-containing protein [Bacillus cereus]MCU5624076.1 helix-turn-helix domain-containing protein [Bacillus cereus]
MGQTFNTEEVLRILKDCYITDSVQTLRKWIREGRIIASGSPYKQEGYTIKEEDLIEFIEAERPGFLDILKVYHQINDEIPLGITLIINRRKPKVTTLIEEPWEGTGEMEAVQFDSNNDLGIILDMLEELEQQMQELKGIVENGPKEASEGQDLGKVIDMKLGQLKSEIIKDVLEVLKKQKSATKSVTKKLGKHGKKAEATFTTFLKTEFWEPRPELGKLEGDIRKKFNEEAKRCYPLFYNERGLFRDDDLGCEHGLEFKTKVNDQEVVIKGQDRKGLMKKYFEVIFLPKIQSEKVETDKKGDKACDAEEAVEKKTLDLASRVKEDEGKPADVS